MWRYIFRRELLDHMTSMRFALTLILSVLLMGLNGLLTGGGKFQGEMNSFIKKRQGGIEWLEQRTNDLAELGVRGPGMLFKQPSPLGFCAAGRDDYLPDSINAGYGTTYGGNWGMWIYEPWCLRYNAPDAPPKSGIVTEFAELDWVFIIGLVLSLMAILLTFDGICGDRQAGTLQLMLSGRVPRAAVIAGKFLGALTVLLLALMLGVLVNLTIIRTLGSISLNAAMLLKMAVMVGTAIFYLAFFVALGLLVSSRCERPATSLVNLLLIWTVLLFLLPNTTAGLVSSLKAGQEVSQEEWDAEKQANWERHGIRELHYSGEEKKPPYAFVEKIAGFIDEWLVINRRFAEALLGQNLDQVRLGRDMNVITPFGIFQSVMESLADTGLPRHLRFIREARKYEKSYREFVRRQDAADPDSYHLMGVIEGVSHRAVPPETVPRFSEDLSAQATILSTLPDLLLLALFALIAFMAAHLAFLRARIA